MRLRLSASQSNITVEKRLTYLENENTEIWQKLHGHDIVAGERLQEKIKSRAFTINRASVLGFRAISGRHVAASKVFGFLGLSPINKNSWTDNSDLSSTGEYSIFAPCTA